MKKVQKKQPEKKPAKFSQIERGKYIDALVDSIIGRNDSPATTLRLFEAANDEIGPEERKLILRGK